LKPTSWIWSFTIFFQFKWFQYWKIYCKWLKTENKTKVNIKVLLKNMINISLF